MRSKSWQCLCLAILAALVFGAVRADAQSPEFAASFARATTTLYEMVNVSNPQSSGIPREILAKAHGIAVFPGVVKGAFLIGGTAGDGHDGAPPDGSWSPPAVIRMAGGSVGFQIGAEITDVVLLIMTPKGLQGLLSSEFTIGADVSAAAGPAGSRGEVSTDLKFSTDLLTYSRTQGLFLGFSFSGASVRSRDDWNQSLYGRGHTIRRSCSAPTRPSPGRAGLHPDGRRVHRPGRQPAAAQALALHRTRAAPESPGAAPPHSPNASGSTRAAVYPGT
jgi:lipid-binding SYLF domain-containing protein